MTGYWLLNSSLLCWSLFAEVRSAFFFLFLWGFLSTQQQPSQLEAAAKQQQKETETGAPEGSQPAASQGRGSLSHPPTHPVGLGSAPGRVKLPRHAPLASPALCKPSLSRHPMCHGDQRSPAQSARAQASPGKRVLLLTPGQSRIYARGPKKTVPGPLPGGVPAAHPVDADRWVSEVPLVPSVCLPERPRC